MKLTTDYIAASTNRFPTVADITSDSIVFFGSFTLVCIWKADDDGGITETLSGHEGIITCIRSLSPTSFDKQIEMFTSGHVLKTMQFARAVVLAGHDDWVKSLTFGSSSTNVLVLASGSQDGTIRLWNFEKYQKEARNGAAGSSLSDALLDAFEESLGDFTDAEEGGRQVSLKRHFLSIKSAAESSVYSITFDALLIGHEAGITSVTWQPKYDQSSTPALLSTSTDSSVILWSPSSVITNSGDASASIWINRQRFGDVGGQRLGGFVGGVWKKDGEEVMAWGWSGGWRRWKLVNKADDAWEEIGATGGHSGHVKDLDWSPNGAYLISAGLDQTVRVHGPITSPNRPATWHELSRPQVHGYDCLGVTFLEDLKFASISDEKVTRIFEAPQRFVSLVEVLKVWHFEQGMFRGIGQPQQVSLLSDCRIKRLKV
ncbi:Elongator subunit elp2 [Marasmius crinis-equi]|uniref:Elongator complex protein 2 n=1 Tax=Marasmius crinis-equi TaxID=585013 RepID=A0ABR3FQH7_9AGAR